MPPPPPLGCAALGRREIGDERDWFGSVMLRMSPGAAGSWLSPGRALRADFALLPSATGVQSAVDDDVDASATVGTVHTGSSRWHIDNRRVSKRVARRFANKLHKRIRKNEKPRPLEASCAIGRNNTTRGYAPKQCGRRCVAVVVALHIARRSTTKRKTFL